MAYGRDSYEGERNMLRRSMRGKGRPPKNRVNEYFGIPKALRAVGAVKAYGAAVTLEVSSIVCND